MVLKSMKIVKNVTSGIEREFYGSKNTMFLNIKIKGEEDGESAFKECKNISVINSSLFLRYPFWHTSNLILENTKMYKTTRAAIWYCKDVQINHVYSKGIKAVRECEDVNIKDSSFDSSEFGWMCQNIEVFNSEINAMYGFFKSQNVFCKNINFKGKYSFQYIKNIIIEDSILHTKDAFWHTDNGTFKNCTIIGEYLAWYSSNLTFINCHIKGTQPFCYCKNLTLIDCTFEQCDLGFENSEVNGNIIGSVISIKNPLKGKLIIDQIPEVIINKFDKSKGKFQLIENKK